MDTNFNEELRDKIKECIGKDSEYKKYYECNKLFHEIFRFCVTGFLAFIVDYLILILFKEVFNFEVLFSDQQRFWFFQ